MKKSKWTPTLREIGQIKRIYGDTQKIKQYKNGGIQIRGRTC